MPMMTIGRPNLSQPRKSICMPRVLLIRPTAMALVGLPTKVPRPPIEAAKATPMIRAPAKPSVSFSFMPPATSTASAIGTMISVEEVLEISMLSRPVAAMKANNMPQALFPDRPMIASASLLCRPTRSIASARKAPPRIRNRIGE